jgi:hypothetical protein
LDLSCPHLSVSFTLTREMDNYIRSGHNPEIKLFQSQKTWIAIYVYIGYWSGLLVTGQSNVDEKSGKHPFHPRHT